MSEAMPSRPRKRIEKRGRVYVEGRWRDLSLSEWNEVARELALAFVIAPQVFLGAFNVATDPQIHGLMRKRLHELENALAVRKPEGVSIRKKEDANGTTIAVVKEKSPTVDLDLKWDSEVNFEVVFPAPEAEQQLTVQFRGFDMEDVDREMPRDIKETRGSKNPPPVDDWRKEIFGEHF